MEIRKINILGDSITWGYEPITGKKLTVNYSELLKEKLNLEVLNNYGISGSTLASGENAFEPMCLRYLQMETDADLVIVFGGTNDYDPMSEKPIALGNIDEKDIKTIYGALNEICGGLKKKFPASGIFFMTPLKKAYENENNDLDYKIDVKNDLGYTLEDVRNAIMEVCQKHQIDVFDLYCECGINTKEDCLKYLPDGLHPTEEYHKILAEKMADFIEKKYKKEKMMPEIWDLLDEKRKKIGKTIQKGEPIPEGLYHLGADVWIVNSENKIFIQKRSPKKRLSPNVWAMTGGSTIKGETTLQTIERETFEELGIKLNIENVKFVKCFKEGNVWIDTYLTRQDILLSDITMQEGEVCEVSWADFSEIEELVSNGQFIEGRWGYIRDFMKEFLENRN